MMVLAVSNPLQQSPSMPPIREDVAELRMQASRTAQRRDWSGLRQVALAWVRREPDSVEAWQGLSRAYFEVSAFDQAMAAFDRVVTLAPRRAEFHVAAARIATAAQHYERARTHLDAAERLAPDSGDVSYARCRVAYLTGDLEQSEAFCRRALALRPGFVPAHVTLGMLTEGRLSDGEIHALRRLLDDARLHPEYRAMLNFTLGDALDRRDDCPGAFAAWDAANAINRQISAQEGIAYRRQDHEQEVDLLRALFDPAAGDDTHRDPITPSPGAPLPIFVVGMPRSGTTLVESILAAHSTVQGAGELPGLIDRYEAWLTTARERGVNVALAQLQQQAAHWRAEYLASLPTGAEARWVVDKQPLNYRAIGLIRRLFPESPIFYTDRHPVDVGFSIYRHDFSKRWPCAHDLADIGHYLGGHRRIMDFWRQRYGAALHTVDHAALVADPETEIRRILAFAGLDFEAGCLNPHENRRAIATFSAVQVRRPLSAAYGGRAQRYRSWLGPLIQVLAAAESPAADTPDAARRDGGIA